MKISYIVVSHKKYYSPFDSAEKAIAFANGPKIQGYARIFPLLEPK